MSTGIKTSDVEAVVSSIIDDKQLFNQVYSIVKSKLKDDWKQSDIRWCNMVINYAIELTLDDLSLIDLVKSLKRKYPSKRRREKASRRDEVIEANIRNTTTEEIGNESALQENNGNSNNISSHTDLSRASSDVKPTFSSTEPVQITTSPGRRHKNYATTGETQTLPPTHKINKLLGKLPPSTLSERILDSGQSIFAEANDQSALESSNAKKGISNSNDDQVLIQMSNEGDTVSEDSLRNFGKRLYLLLLSVIRYQLTAMITLTEVI